jgi:sulfonate transport system substrate-binding protein
VRKLSRPAVSVLAAGIVATLLAACSSAGASNTAATSSATSTASAAAAASSGSASTPAHSAGSSADPGTSGAATDLSGVTLTLGQQGSSLQAEVEASGVLKGAPYKVNWATFSGPTGVIAAFDAKGIDLGVLGDTSLILKQANSATPWTAATVPYKNVAVYGSIVADKYPVFVTLASKSSGITSASQLRGKKWAYVPGGNTNLMYLLSLKAAGLAPTDIKPVILQDFTSLGTALANNQIDAASLPRANALGALAAGAQVIYTGAEVGVPGINTWAAPVAVLADPRKAAAIGDLLTRFVAFYAWYSKSPDAVAAALVKSVKQTPTVAAYNAVAGQSRFFPINDSLFTIEQPVAAALAAGGLTKSSVDVTLEYDNRYNALISAAEQKLGVPNTDVVLQK